MALTVSARMNTLAGRTKSWRFHTCHSGAVSFERLMDIMAASHTTLSLPDIVACMTLFSQTVSSLVADGKFVKGPLGDYYLCAVGTIDSPSETFNLDSGKGGHGLRLRFRPDRRTEQGMARQARVKRDDSLPSREPHPLSLEAAGQPRGSPLAASAIVRLVGYHLKLDPSDPTQGIFLASSPQAPLLRCPVYASITPSHIIAQLPPALEAGGYSVLVRSMTKTGKIREGWLKERIDIGPSTVESGLRLRACAMKL